MRKIRKVNTNKRKKERKVKQQELQEQTSLLMNHPQDCCICNAPFVRSPETVNTWKVTVIREKKRVRLTCPTCWDKFAAQHLHEGTRP